MSQEQWTEVDNYLNRMLVPSDAVLEDVLKFSREAGLPEINVAPNQGRLLAILAQSIGARKILEVGTLGGYSTIWLARTLPARGKLITLEVEEKHAKIARENIERAGLAGVVEVRLGRAIEMLPKLAQEGIAPFDLVFIDADKPSNADYFEWALKLTRRGSLIIVDNVVRNGRVSNAGSTDPNVLGVRRLFELMKDEPRITATAIQTVGSKGYDGLAVALVTGD